MEYFTDPDNIWFILYVLAAVIGGQIAAYIHADGKFTLRDFFIGLMIACFSPLIIFLAILGIVGLLIEASGKIVLFKKD